MKLEKRKECSEMANQTYKPGVASRQVGDKTRTNINLWLTSNAVTSSRGVRVRKHTIVLGNKKARRRKAYEPKYKIILKISTRRL